MIFFKAASCSIVINEKFWLFEANAFYTGLDGVFEEEQIATNVFEKRNGERVVRLAT